MMETKEQTDMTVTRQTALRKLIEEYPGCYQILLTEGIKLTCKTIATDEILGNYLPEEKADTMLDILNEVVKRIQKENEKATNLYEELIQAGKVNIAGFADFTWHEAFETEMMRYASEQNIGINFRFFLKSNKKQFQTYLQRATKVDELPDILVGKGFSSLMTQKFIDTFVHTGCFDCDLAVPLHPLWHETGLKDKSHQYHAFGAEELVVLYDESKDCKVAIPRRWSDLQKPEYKDSITQMGKPQRDHFGFSSLFYLHQQGGEAAIRAYAGNVNHKWHFSKIIKDIGKNHPEASPFNVVQRYSTLFVRSEAKARILEMEDGNPVTTFFCLVKKGSNEAVLKIAQHLFSTEVAQIIEQAGAISAHPASVKANRANIRWIGWDTIKNATLPYLKEELSDIAFQVYKQ